MQLEHGYHYGLGYEWRPDHLWSIDSEIYYVDRYNLVVYTDAAVMNADGTYSYLNFDNLGKSHSYGFEAIIKREISPHLYGWLSYTYSRARQQDAPGDAWIPTAFDEPHVLNAVASWKPGAGFELGARFQLASGRPDTPVIGATYDADLGEYIPVIMARARSIRIPTFIASSTCAPSTTGYSNAGASASTWTSSTRRTRRTSRRSSTTIATGRARR